MTDTLIDAVALAAIFLGGSLAYVWIASLVRLGRVHRQLAAARRQLAARRPPPVDRLLWDSETWEDPREALALEACKARQPVNRNR